jgi:hypothetical protein
VRVHNRTPTRAKGIFAQAGLVASTPAKVERDPEAYTEEEIDKMLKGAGHKSPTTILRYYAKVKLEQKEHRQKATQAFDRFSAVGE